MAFVKIEDLTAETELILFPSVYQQTIGIWERDRVVLIRGKINAKDRDGNMTDEVKIMVDDAREVTVEQAQAYQATGKKARIPKVRAANTSKGPGAKATTVIEAKQKIYIKVDDEQDEELLVKLKSAIDQNQGNTEVILVTGKAGNRQAIKLPNGLNLDDDVLALLRLIVGQDNIRIQ